MSLTFGIPLILLCLLFTAFVAACEMGVVSLNRLRLRHRVDSGEKKALLINRLLQQPAKLLGTILVASNISVIVATTVTTVLVKTHLTGDENLIPFISTGVLFPLVVIFGELVPKSIARSRSEQFVSILTQPLRITSWILFPVVFAVTQISNLLVRITGRTDKDKNPFVTPEELKLLVKEELQDRELHKHGREMLYRIFELEQTCARDIMVPLTDVTAVEADKELREVIELMRQSGHSRLPVYFRHIGDIKGIVRASDLIDPAGRKRRLRELVVPPYVVPESKPIDTILQEMQQNQQHLAIVANRHGNISGILTLEDIIEEIVGEIEDEYDRPPEARKPVAQ